MNFLVSGEKMYSLCKYLTLMTLWVPLSLYVHRVHHYSTTNLSDTTWFLPSIYTFAATTAFTNCSPYDADAFRLVSLSLSLSLSLSYRPLLCLLMNEPEASSKNLSIMLGLFVVWKLLTSRIQANHCCSSQLANSLSFCI
jgi:hypothetical protein